MSGTGFCVDKVHGIMKHWSWRWIINSYKISKTRCREDGGWKGTGKWCDVSKGISIPLILKFGF